MCRHGACFLFKHGHLVTFNFTNCTVPVEPHVQLQASHTQHCHRPNTHIPSPSLYAGFSIIISPRHWIPILTASLVYKLSIWWAWIQISTRRRDPENHVFGNTTVAHLKNIWTPHTLIEITPYGSDGSHAAIFAHTELVSFSISTFWNWFVTQHMTTCVCCSFQQNCENETVSVCTDTVCVQYVFSRNR